MRGALRGRAGRLGVVAALSVAICMFAGCGLETISYLYPPGTRDVGDNDIAAPPSAATAFTHAVANNTGDFISLGYSVYYRIYLSPAKAASDRALIDQLNTDDPTQVEAKLRSQLHYYPFDSIDTLGSGVQTGEAPTIALLQAEYGTALSFNVVIPGYSSIPATEAGVFRSTSTGTDNPRLLRSSKASIADPLSSFFNLKIAASDPDGDVDATGFTVSPCNAYLQIVVLSYGVDAVTFAPTFSTAVLLRGANDPFILYPSTVTP